jgi:ABC-type amino acid transport substrate-binding protein
MGPEGDKWGALMTPKHMMAVTVIVAFAACVLAVQAQQAPDPRVADLVQSGKLRVALGLGSPVLAMKDPKSGEVRGPALDLARALATKIGVELKPVEYPRPGAILAGVKNNEWDVTFLVADPARSAEADFSPPYIQSDLRIWYRLAPQSAQSLTWINREFTLRSRAEMRPTSV